MQPCASERFGTSDSAKRSKPLRFEFEKLARGNVQGNHSAERRHSDRAFRVFVGSGRGCVLHALAMPTVLIPLRGRVKLTESESARTLHTGQLFVGEGGNRIQAIGSGDALWLAFTAPTSVWRQLVDAISEQSIPAPVLLPATHAADRAILRVATRLAREGRAHPA
jgi:hypothetical protein